MQAYFVLSSICTIFAQDRRRFGTIFKQALYSALNLHYLCIWLLTLNYERMMELLIILWIVGMLFGMSQGRGK